MISDWPSVQLGRAYGEPKRGMVTLTDEESKRLIAKGIARMPAVIHALKHGIIGLSMCTSAGYVAEELMGRKLGSIAAYCSGYINHLGGCGVPEDLEEKEIALVKGEPLYLDFGKENLTKVIDQMDAGDIIVKSGNALDPNKKAGVLCAELDGGEYGDYLPYILSKGIHLVVPMTLNKSVPSSIEDISNRLGISRMEKDRLHGMACGMLPLPGTVVTEVDAISILTGACALPVAMSGVGRGKGTVTLLLEGDEQTLEAAWNVVMSVKGEPPLKEIPGTCASCSLSDESTAAGLVCSTKRIYRRADH